MEMVSRREWGAVAARGSTPLQPSRVVALVLHHTTGTYSGFGTVRQIQAFHQGPQRGWADIGYNLLVAPDGTVFEGRGWGIQGAHAKGHNASSIGVAYIGDGRQPVSDAAKFAILRVAEEADRRMGKKLRRVGHRDVGSTVCPGDVLHAWWMSSPSLPAAEPKPAPKPAPEPEPAPKPRTGLPDLPAGLRWGQGGLPRIPWLRIK